MGGFAGHRNVLLGVTGGLIIYLARGYYTLGPWRWVRGWSRVLIRASCIGRVDLSSLIMMRTFGGEQR